LTPAMKIGELAMRYLDDGVEVTNDYWDAKGAVEATRRYINDGHDLIFEATLMTSSQNSGGVMLGGDIHAKAPLGRSGSDLTISAEVADCFALAVQGIAGIRICESSP